MFDARLLSVFREVATRGSFSEAATALSFTQPAVSQQIARLERELGDTRKKLAMGGGAGTSVGTAAMRALPIGVPKIMVSTLASGDDADRRPPLAQVAPAAAAALSAFAAAARRAGWASPARARRWQPPR